ncbi:Sterile alpha motif domain-containing protein 9 [Channa argus]|uniref:Sterile alpha motif domain-containing protein 9 n=1 Tax=Channa argus TaxID=215402 RepID=A0A6G1PY81_CHAAH|nr:Sterile alpha motif domain-containing protein 9 [Channa argus]
MADQDPMKNPEENLNHDTSRDEQVKNNVRRNSTNQLRLCQPYPFQQYHNSYRYITNYILNVTESGPLNLIEPCHEYKGFINTTDETRMTKLISEVIRFAAVCMNSRTNGTIHFGIGDKPKFIHGQVLGVVVEDKEAYANKLKSTIDSYFEHKHIQAAQMCIKPPRFVGVLNKNMTSSDKCVIEVDIVPDSMICKEDHYHTFITDTKKAKKKGRGTNGTQEESKQFFVRDGGSSRDLLKNTTFAKPMEEYNTYVASVANRSKLRKQAEDKHLTVIKSSTQGFRLSQMITGGSHSLDKSHFEQYVIVTNKSHPSQFESLGFLTELNPTAVLDFDPESAKHGLQCHFDQQSTVHLPTKCKITEGLEDIGNKQLKLTGNTSWVFCNGGIEDQAPSDIDQWLMDKGASVQDVISFLCRKDVLPNKRFLVVFLLLSPVSEMMDPLVETYSKFQKELGSTNQILSICDNENALTSWKNLIEARCGIDITGRCINELSFAEVNGTILSLLPKYRRASCFLPCGGGSKVLLEKKVERSLNTLDVLCVNQCEGGNVDQIAIEENFYRGGKPSWWNFYFSEQLIKRNHTDLIHNNILEMRSCSEACVLFNLSHVPGCGGTTLAMYTLWSLRDKFRCAVLKDNNADLAEIADQVVKLLMFDNQEKLPRVPVLLMVDDFDDMDKVFDLQQRIKHKCKKNIRSAQVILLNCMRSESPEQTETTEHGIFIGKHLVKDEQKQFEKKLVEQEKTHNNVETFYTFMLTKNNLKAEYIQGVVHNTLRSFNFKDKHSQILAILSLLNVYCKDASLPFSLCRKFVSLNPKPIFGTYEIDEIFGKFSNLIHSTTAKSQGEYRAVKMIHSKIAKFCLQELKTTHKVTKADITNLLLRTHELYEHTEDKGKFWQDVHSMLVVRYSDGFLFFYQLFLRFLRHIYTPKFSNDGVLGNQTTLFKEIESETPELLEMVLLNASKRFENEASIAHLLATYYSQTQDLKQAEEWNHKAKTKISFSFPLGRLQTIENLRN